MQPSFRNAILLYSKIEIYNNNKYKDNEFINIMDNNKFIAGGLAGIVEVITTHPIDYMKIKAQEYKQIGKSYNNFYKDIGRNGIRSYYSGIIPRLCGIIPMRLTFWGVQDNTKLLLEKNNINTPYNFLLIAISGGFFQTIIDNQIELLKIGQMTNISKLNLTNSLLRFRGFNTSLVRNIGFTSCLSYYCFNKNMEDNTIYDKIIYSATGGVLGSILTQPIDYVKTQKQRCNDERPMFRILAQTYKENPMKLYTGGMYRAGLSIFTMSIGFTSYDFFRNLLENKF